MRGVLVALLLIVAASSALAQGADPLRDCRIAVDPTKPLSSITDPASVEKCNLAITAKPQLDVSHFYFARALHAAGRLPEAIAEYEAAANLGHTKAAIAVGLMYINGLGTSPDAAEAARWFEKAALRQNDEARLLLGDMYVAGVGVVQDYFKAADYYNAVETNVGGGDHWALAQLCALPELEKYRGSVPDTSKPCVPGVFDMGVRDYENLSPVETQLMLAARDGHPEGSKRWAVIERAAMAKREELAKQQFAILALGAGLLYLLATEGGPSQPEPGYSGPSKCDAAKDVYTFSGETAYMLWWC